MYEYDESSGTWVERVQGQPGEDAAEAVQAETVAPIEGPPVQRLPPIAFNGTDEAKRRAVEAQDAARREGILARAEGIITRGDHNSINNPGGGTKKKSSFLDGTGGAEDVTGYESLGNIA